MFYKQNNIKVTASTFVDKDGTGYPFPSWFNEMSDEELATMGLTRHDEPVKPAFNELTHKAIKDASGEWATIALTTDELDDLEVTVVTMRQARLALLSAGVLSAIDAVISGMPSPQKEAAQIEWEYAATVNKHSPLVVGLADGLGLTADQIDELFDNASKL